MFDRIIKRAPNRMISDFYEKETKDCVFSFFICGTTAFCAFFSFFFFSIGSGRVSQVHIHLATTLLLIQELCKNQKDIKSIG